VHSLCITASLPEKTQTKDIQDASFVGQLANHSALRHMQMCEVSV
jgi:hypothetical protein